MARPLITARDVEQTRNLVVPPGAIVTPLARELIRRRGLPIQREALAVVGRQPRRLVVANWKSHKTVVEAETFARTFRQLDRRRQRATAVICPPFTALDALRRMLGKEAELGAQDVSAHGEGAHTGCITAAMLVELECRFAIVGHSERRHAGEDDALCRAKVRAALRGGLDPILCVGETQAEREAGRAERIVRIQLVAALEGLAPDELRRTVVAYEPRWAIGTGLTPTSAQVEEMLASLRRVLESVGQIEAARRVSVLYGGSVNERNAAELLALPGCSGALIGGASLSPERFGAILAAS